MAMTKRKSPHDIIELLSSDDDEEGDPRISPISRKRHAYGTQQDPVDLTEMSAAARPVMHWIDPLQAVPANNPFVGVLLPDPAPGLALHEYEDMNAAVPNFADALGPQNADPDDVFWDAREPEGQDLIDFEDDDEEPWPDTMDDDLTEGDGMLDDVYGWELGDGPAMHDPFLPDRGHDIEGTDDLAPLATAPPFVNAKRVETLAPDRSKDSGTHECVDTCSELFPEIDPDHVLLLLERHNGSTGLVINHLLDQGSGYPRKVKRLVEKDTKTESKDPWTLRTERGPVSARERDAIVDLLKTEFTEVPIKYIRQKIDEKTYAYDTYLALDDAQNLVNRPYRKASTLSLRGRAAYHKVSKETIEFLAREIAAARELCNTRAHERKNQEEAEKQGSVSDCMICFDQYPLNRMLSCAGQASHHICFDCAKQYVENEVGMSRSAIACPSSAEECRAVFTHTELRKAVSNALVSKLERVQQQRDIQEAGIADIAECPFCDYKAIYPTVEQNFIFVCESPDCGKSSCRRCNQDAHVPITCEEYRKKKIEDGTLSKRHLVEEAMTEALVRTCNKCKKKFVKEYGCNKMTCSCGNVQCYSCGKNCEYKHFRDYAPTPENKNGCLLNENVEERHRQEVQKAMEAAKAEIKKDDPTVTDEQLDMKTAADPIRRPRSPPGLRRYVPEAFGPAQPLFERHVRLHQNDFNQRDQRLARHEGLLHHYNEDIEALNAHLRRAERHVRGVLGASGNVLNQDVARRRLRAEHLAEVDRAILRQRDRVNAARARLEQGRPNDGLEEARGQYPARARQAQQGDNLNLAHLARNQQFANQNPAPVAEARQGAYPNPARLGAPPQRGDLNPRPPMRPLQDFNMFALPPAWAEQRAEMRPTLPAGTGFYPAARNFAEPRTPPEQRGDLGQDAWGRYVQFNDAYLRDLFDIPPHGEAGLNQAGAPEWLRQGYY